MVITKGQFDHASMNNFEFTVQCSRFLLNKKVLLASLKTLRNTETCTENRDRILLRLTISVIGWFSLRDHLSLDRGKVSLKKHVIGSLRNKC